MKIRIDYVKLDDLMNLLSQLAEDYTAISLIIDPDNKEIKVEPLEASKLLRNSDSSDELYQSLTEEEIIRLLK